MIRVRNRHVSHVGGIAPGAVADIEPAVLARHPWAFIVLPADHVQGAHDNDDADWLPAREQREALRASEDLDYVRGFVGDSRSSVHTAAVRRIRQLTEGEKE